MVEVKLTELEAEKVSACIRVQAKGYEETLYKLEPIEDDIKPSEMDELRKRVAFYNELADRFSPIKYNAMKRTNVITLCGSTKFKEEFEQVNKALTLQGNIVISVGVFVHDGEEISLVQKTALDALHLRKIDMSDAIFVINKGGYIGASTRGEIEYAEAMGKTIYYYEKP